FEFQRLHGMGETLHEVLHRHEGTNCRIYAPVGPHKELLAYLVRRLLENGANGSFVYQIADADIPAAKVAEDPIGKVLKFGNAIPNPAIPAPAQLFGASRANSTGFDLTDPVAVEALMAARAPFEKATWQAGPLIAGGAKGETPVPVR
ncbi:MAG TPA: proline dehydrogenase family protein, partial [Rhabdaerophilum sp.]|nr:proline dehydrogenase family protein [Rhabdaerophilum sp.]